MQRFISIGLANLNLCNAIEHWVNECSVEGLEIAERIIICSTYSFTFDLFSQEMNLVFINSRLDLGPEVQISLTN